MFEELEIHIEEVEMYIQNIYKAVNDYASGTYESFKLDDKALSLLPKVTHRTYQILSVITL
ncbi:hypothetical protein EFO35_04730 [Lactococcus cremoris]|uniref:hypothetical protein n=1 Tax=Lactococcus lactis subsp. cremoris TaxID=1359 RepID=UPI0021AA1176|nr:hypothetical protein [Lactococcus cremoris]MCT4454366.1 hypothetical protein [Lactococcus cremoris]